MLCLPQELSASEAALPDEAELASLSKLYNDGLEAARHAIGAGNVRDKGAGKSAMVFNLFAETDVDGNGFVTYDEFEYVTRKKMGLKKSDLAAQRLMALWCVLDANDSDAIDTEEFAKFLKGVEKPELLRALLDEGRQRAKPPPGVAGRPLQMQRSPRPPREPKRVFDWDEYERARPHAVHSSQLRIQCAQCPLKHPHRVRALQV